MNVKSEESWSLVHAHVILVILLVISLCTCNSVDTAYLFSSCTLDSTNTNTSANDVQGSANEREHCGRIDALQGSSSLFRPLDAFVNSKAHLNTVAEEKSSESLPLFRVFPDDFLLKSVINLRRILIAYHLDLIAA